MNPDFFFLRETGNLGLTDIGLFGLERQKGEKDGEGGRGKKERDRKREEGGKGKGGEREGENMNELGNGCDLEL